MLSNYDTVSVECAIYEKVRRLGKLTFGNATRKGRFGKASLMSAV
jgi:hypothetical protein